MGSDPNTGRERGREIMLMLGVYTRYLGPTNHRGSRIKVTWGNESKTVSYDYAAQNAHESAVHEVMASWGYVVDSMTHVCPTESHRGSVYSVTVAQCWRMFWPSLVLGQFMSLQQRTVRQTDRGN